MSDALTKPKRRHPRSLGRKLTSKQLAFAHAYGGGKLTAKAAAIEAGYSPKSTKSQTFDLLNDPLVMAEVEAIREKLREKSAFDAHAAFEEAGRLMQAAQDAGQFNAAIRATEHRAKLHGLVQNKLEVKIEEQVDLAGALAEARARATLRPICDPAQITDAEYTAGTSTCDAGATDCQSVAALPAPPGPRSPDMDS